jgi:type VI secretion system protein ImpK
MLSLKYWLLRNNKEYIMLQEILIKNLVLKNARALFQLVTLLKTEIPDETISENYHEKIVQALKDFEKQAVELNWDHYTTTNAKYALIAYTDEIVLNSTWPGRTTWMQKPLQLEFFGEHTAGEVFFERLQKLRESGSQYIDLLELYYICIQLGFQGKYRLYHPEQLLGLQADLRSQIEAIRRITTNQLSPNKSIKQIINIRRYYLPLRTVVIASAIALSLIYIGCSFIISYRAHESIAKIDTMQSAMVEQLQEKL